MKVQELLAEEKLLDYFNRLITKHGIEKLGGGAFSQVFQHPQFHNVVVKVYRNKDKPFKKYLDWCIKNQSNPFVPQVIEQVKFKSKEDSYNIVFMQKMTSLKDESELAAKLASALNLDDNEADELEDLLDETCGSGTDFFNFMTKAAKAKKTNKNFAAVWDHIATYPKKQLDLHAGNAMLRGDQLVITDPVALDPTSRVNEI